jgi:translation initiation factor 1
VANICPVCGLPFDIHVCEELEREGARITVRMEMRRWGRPTTVIEGLDPKRNDIQKLAGELKRRLACGGTAKEGQIILQGDHRDAVRQHLLTLGFRDSQIEVQ